MKKKRPTISFNLPFIFGEKVSVSKAHQYNTKWGKITGAELAEMKLKDFLKDGYRFVLEGKIGPHKLWIATHDEDYQQIRMKYKNDLVVHPMQFINLFRGGPRELEIENILVPAALLGATVTVIQS